MLRTDKRLPESNKGMLRVRNDTETDGSMLPSISIVAQGSARILGWNFAVNDHGVADGKRSR